MVEGKGSSVRARTQYEAIHNRTGLQLPGDARVVVWTIVNVEVWSPFGVMPRAVLPPPMGQTMLPDIANWSWHEYGMRVGFWRLLSSLQRLGIPVTFAVNGKACSIYPEACNAALTAGWEFIGHGFEQRPMHTVADEWAAISATIKAIKKLTGHTPRGWESPGLTETDMTLDLLKEAGIEYVADWVMDDQPSFLQTKGGPLVAMPYTVELNDVVLMAVQNQSSSELLTRGIDQFERLYQEGSESPRVMAISLHPYLTGVPHRIGYLEKLYEHIQSREDVVFWTGSEILDWYQSQTLKA
ncbi:MAG TPA: polysaccharide deacetylase family protein [Paenalcaligenes sp.]|nr:polysaccharide deacetylase family protein [Paenalcaligenes sp.]